MSNVKRSRLNIEPELTPEQQARALDVDKTLCFICQEKPQTQKLTSRAGIFECCDDCTRAVESENNRRNKVRQALCQNDRTHIFQYTLGMNPSPNKIKVEKL